MEKIMKKSTLILLTFLLVSSAAFAQESYKNFHHAQKKHAIRGIGFSAGYYSPGMDSYNKMGMDFKGAFTGSLNLEYWISKNFLSARAGVGYFSSSAKTDSPTFPEETTVSLIPLTLDVLVYLSGANNRYATSPPLAAYAGFGVDFNMISSEYKSPLSTQSSSGKSTAFHGILGFDYGATKNLYIGPEMQYVFGNYSQSFLTTGDNLYSEDVSLSGLKFLVHMTYQF
jgi:hypothetical protein